jgi:hypothetical protein
MSQVRSTSEGRSDQRQKENRVEQRQEQKARAEGKSTSRRKKSKRELRKKNDVLKCMKNVMLDSSTPRLLHSQPPPRLPI